MRTSQSLRLNHPEYSGRYHPFNEKKLRERLNWERKEKQSLQISFHVLLDLAQKQIKNNLISEKNDCILSLIFRQIKNWLENLKIKYH